MARAIDRAEAGDVALGQLWVDIARELREGSKVAKPLASGGIVTAPVGDFRLAGGEQLVDRRGETLVPTPRPLRDADEPVVRSAEHVMQEELDAELRADLEVESDSDTLYGYRRGQSRPPSVTAYRAAVSLRKALDRGEELALHGALHIDRNALDSLVFEILQRAPLSWRQDLPVDGSGPLAGQIETSDEREQRFASAPPVRPYVGTYAPDRDEHTRVLDGGDPNSCRHCGHEIETSPPPSEGYGPIFVHTMTQQRVCPTPPLGRTAEGDESYVSGPHTFAAPGGLPYRRR
jgi:hypothetical protein